MKNIALTCLITFLSFSLFSQNNQKIENQKTFAKAYGYVKYFHPSDEAAQIDWKQFAVYGAQEVEKCSNKKELITTLNRLFKPIAPSVIFANTKTVFDLKKITPNNPKKHESTFWQHKGVSTGMQYQKENSPYKSVRVNRIVKTENASDFGNIMTAIDAEKYRGKEIKYTGYVKLKEGTKGNGHLWIRIDKTDRSYGFFNNMDANPVKSNKWQQYEIIGSVDSLAKSIVFGCFLSGKGRLYVDKLQLYYKEGNTWIEIPIKNSDFETEPLAEKKDKAKWVYRGKGYSFKTYNNESFEGEKSAMIDYVGEIKTEKGTPIFKFEPKFGEIIEEEIGKGIYCQIPLVLYCNKENTFPVADNENFKKLKNKLENSDINPTILSVRLGNTINAYNVFQHFYPYFDVVDVDWDKELKKALLRCYSDKTDNDHLITLQKFTSPLKDGHIWVSGGSYETNVPPISWEWIENKLVITKVFNDDINVKKGDVVSHINNQTTKDFFNEVNSRISAPTTGWLNYRNKNISLFGNPNSTITLTIENEKIKLNRDDDFYKKGKARSSVKKKAVYKKIEDNIYYLNLDLIEMDTIKMLLPQLKKSKAIICDLRGYPNGNHDFISYLLKSDDTSTSWMQIPQVVYPNQEKLIGHENEGWLMKAKKPYLGDKKIVFIIDGSAISYAESYMGFIEGYKLATIIGQPTAGTNGNVNPFSLVGGYRVNWTGMKVLKHDGSQHHNIGVLPNVYITKTIKGIKEKRDEFLEKALEIAKQK
jgi:C-terminal processing protease CtpA/Prc